MHSLHPQKKKKKSSRLQDINSTIKVQALALKQSGKHINKSALKVSAPTPILNTPYSGPEQDLNVFLDYLAVGLDGPKEGQEMYAKKKSVIEQSEEEKLKLAATITDTFYT